MRFAIAALWATTTAVNAQTIEEVLVLNPTSGVELRTVIVYPDEFTSGGSFPGVVLVPGGSGTSENFLSNGYALSLADNGVVAIAFDPDGRGESTNGGTYTTEDYNGFIQQDGLQAILQHVAAIPGIDPENLGVESRSYGITMAAGCLGRHPNAPRVKFLLEWEGPADRTDTAQPNGHVPVSTDDDEFWWEREPGNFIDDFGGFVIFMQSEDDHVQPDNEHTILLNNRAVHESFGGAGTALWTRINLADGPAGNTPNTVYDATEPNWVAEFVGTNQLMRALVLELVKKNPRPPAADINVDLAVDGADLGLMLSAWGKCAGCPEDLNGDGFVDGADLGLLLSDWTG
jgi:hypothetical protein